MCDGVAGADGGGVREGTFDDPARSVYTLYFQHGGQWWIAEYGLARRCTDVPPMIRLYLDTFRCDNMVPR